MTEGFDVFGCDMLEAAFCGAEPLESRVPMDEFVDPYAESSRVCVLLLSILSAVTHCELPSSASIFLRLISSAMSDIRIHSMPIGVGRAPDLSYTVNSISLAFSMSTLWTSSVHLSVLVALVLPFSTSSTFMATKVSEPLEKRPVAAWSTSLTA